MKNGHIEQSDDDEEAQGEDEIILSQENQSDEINGE
jgi:hypothetical protein